MSGNYNRKDHLYLKAKDEGYRSRAAYKLKELDDKYHLLLPGAKVLDLGAWPGGWMQVARERVGANGLVVGADLVQIEDFSDSSIKVLKGDVRDEGILAEACAAAKGKFDVVLSDMSPKISGVKEVDRYAAIACAELAIWVSTQALKSGGAVVIKVFKSPETDQFVKTSRALFNKFTRAELKSTRQSSNEFYLIGLGLVPG